MLERVINPNCYRSNNNQGLVLATIPNGNTFKLVYHFTPIGMPSAKVNLSSFDLQAIYWIYGYENEPLTIMKPSISNNYCYVDQDQSLIKVIFQRYELKSGQLMQRLLFRLTDPNLPGDASNEIIEGFTGIIIQ